MVEQLLRPVLDSSDASDEWWTAAFDKDKREDVRRYIWFLSLNKEYLAHYSTLSHTDVSSCFNLFLLYFGIVNPLG